VLQGVVDEMPVPINEEEESLETIAPDVGRCCGFFLLPEI